MLKSKLPSETTIPKIVQQVESIVVEWQKKEIKNEKTPFTRVFGDSRITVIQKKLGDKVFYRLIKYYVASL